jgi:NAD(P)-dependent dehydrogenase (short-subunit alcohol dehydrogenase family)
MHDLRDRVAFITGGASGIGLAMAQAFAGAGMRLALADTDEARLEEAVRRLSDAGTPVIGVRIDVTDRDAMQVAAASVETTFGAVHVLCNNAGIIGAGAPLADTTPEEWDSTVAVNLNAVYYGLHAFLPRMIRKGDGGHVVNTSSMAGLIPTPGVGAYTATKFAVAGLTEALREELAPHNIGVSLLCPGFVRTNLIETSARIHPPSDDPARAAIGARMAGAFERGIDAEHVGRAVLEAVRANRPYVLTTGKYRDAFAERTGALLAAMDALGRV